MVLSIDEITLKKLGLLKQLFQQALIHATADHSVIRQTLAVIGFDLAVETTLGIVVTALDPSATPKESFQAIVKQADELLISNSLGGLPNKHQIQKVRSIRNDAQHKMKYPSKLTVSDCRTYANDFIVKVISTIWRLSFEEISLAELVSHTKVKQHLTDAELALSNNQTEKSITDAASGFELALSLIKPAMVGFRPTFAKGFITEDSFGQQQIDVDTFKSFKKMQDILTILSLGITYTDFMSYRRIVGDAQVIPSGPIYFLETKNSIHRDDAEYVVNFCIDSVIKIEEVTSDLDKPFGQDVIRLAKK